VALIAIGAIDANHIEKTIDCIIGCKANEDSINEIIKAIHELAMPPEKPVRQIGFRSDAVSKPRMLKGNTVRATKMRRGL
jgi:hypothetical protein